MSHEVAEADQNLREITRLRAELDATRADLESLRVGMVYLGAERDRAQRWAALWKRAATKYFIANWRLRGILRGERARREDAETALLGMRAQRETENPQ